MCASIFIFTETASLREAKRQPDWNRLITIKAFLRNRWFCFCFTRCEFYVILSTAAARSNSLTWKLSGVKGQTVRWSLDLMCCDRILFSIFAAVTHCGEVINRMQDAKAWNTQSVAFSLLRLTYEHEKHKNRMHKYSWVWRLRFRRKFSVNGTTRRCIQKRAIPLFRTQPLRSDNATHPQTHEQINKIIGFAHKKRSKTNFTDFTWRWLDTGGSIYVNSLARFLFIQLSFFFN